MLSYQHIYHAGNRADIHKHSLLANALECLTGNSRPVLYIETHAGRGLYDLHAPENEKTQEAAQGWLALQKDKAALASLPSLYVNAIRAMNKNGLSPFYPGSPKIAAHILRKNDRLYLYDLHPAEYAALEANMKGDNRIRMQKRDGVEAALSSAPLHARVYTQGLVFIDPSYEIKSEYETMPQFVANLSEALPKISIILWVPMLPKMGHQITLEHMKHRFPDLKISELVWSSAEQDRGMFGSLLLGINMPDTFKFSP